VDAAGLSTGVGTAAALALFRELKLPVSLEQFEKGAEAPPSGAPFVAGVWPQELAPYKW
jgi:hypothetical protein